MRSSTLRQQSIPSKTFTSPKTFTRRFVLAGAGCALAASKLMASNALAAASDSLPHIPTAIDLEIAALGEWLSHASPKLASDIEAASREYVGLLPSATIDWDIAHQARLALTAPERISDELAREDIVFVDNWLLSTSEVGVALLYAAAKNGTDE